MVSSFDIFDTCLLRKCGTPENFFDVFSLRVFNGEVEEWARQEFVAARHLAQQSVQSPSMKLKDVWDAFSWTHPQLKSKEELYQLEQETEREMLVPVLKMRDKVNECREKGYHIVFISDMYLPSSFLREVMQEQGFFKEGDGLYVSCECDAEKWNGKLFEYIREKEKVSFRHWHHYGDNKVGDYKVPRKLGIKAILVNHEYTPYQKKWVDNDYSLGFKYPSILAGLGRALHHSTERTTHTDFVLDIIAPFYCSWMYQVLLDAQEKGIKRLYFCARDAYQIHKIALQMQRLFPNVGIEYVYTSRKALYNEANDEAKIAYFKQIGLATKTDKVAIVDITTSGKTLQYLNEYLKTKGYQNCTAYYYLLWNKVEGADRNRCDVKVYDAYIYNNHNTSSFIHHPFLFIFENLFGLNAEPKTIDYKDGRAIFTYEMGEEDCRYKDGYNWVSVHEGLLVAYANEFVVLHLGQFAKEIFERIGVVALNEFFKEPQKAYVCSLDSFCYIEKETSKTYTFIKKINNPFKLRKKNRTYAWRRGTLYYSFPMWVLKLVKFLKHV